MKMKMKYLVFFIVGFLLTCHAQISFSQSFSSQGATVEKLRGNFLQPEGPVWKDGVGLLFSDIMANKIYRWSPLDSSLVEYLNPSDSSNGLTLDQQGRLVLTQMAKRRVARQELNGDITPLTSMYNGKKYNSPNDVVVKSDGSIFFTDPDFNTPKGQAKEMGFKGVFRLSPTGTVTALDISFVEPNGICFSPDEKKLYVNESPQGKIYVWDVENDSTIVHKNLFYTIPRVGYADGMKVDPSGNLYCTGPSGVWVISPMGVCLDTILLPVNPSNGAWGDADRKSLYITAGNSGSGNKPADIGLYRIRLISTGIQEDQGQLLPNDYELFQNYPNPFNPQTTITYKIPQRSMVWLKVFDVLGKEVTLVNDLEIQGGTYTAQFDGSQHSSGVYFAQLRAVPEFTATSFLRTMKMLLVK
ncbi:MAG: T9SS C-terminal target domain-containing protein [Ignavibacteriae bacterium]|nr:MAG: T9SS C-terminal target domain-containing protein [Ignavibacteriota bacterium]